MAANVTLDDIENLEDESYYEDDSEQHPPSDVIAYNELRSCSDLVRMYNEGTLNIQPDFQRDIVWNSSAQTRFIDSLIKQLPIPSMCFSFDYNSQEWQVIDGLQRMTSIIRFLSDPSWQLSKLEDIDSKISGARVSEFHKQKTELNNFYKRVQNLTIPVTVLRCDHSKLSHMEYLFTIFHRLNSGGTRLNNQEIRNCIFSGEFNTALKEMNDINEWQKIAGLNTKNSNRFKYIELILRFFSFYDNKDKYKGTLSKFLNSYMKKNRHLGKADIQMKMDLFSRTVGLVWGKILQPNPVRLGSSLMEALLYGVAKNIDALEQETSASLTRRFDELRADDSLSTAFLSGGVARKEKVDARLDAALRIFG
ncbi:GmrSD restriction endonuclease domain-containing protein [Citrobacter farmeri]